jgi:cardiolipin synthase
MNFLSRHSREGGNPVTFGAICPGILCDSTPAFAGETDFATNPPGAVVNYAAFKVNNGMAKKILLVGVGVALVFLLVLNMVPRDKPVDYRIPTAFAVDSAEFQSAVGHLLGPPLDAGNHVVEYQNGDQIFPAMLNAIANAKKTIGFETYIYWSGEIGQKFADALSERARAGVKVHVILDWVGSGKMDDKSLEKMKSAGVEVEKYRPLRWYHLARLNHRTHRKLLVVDGKIGFTGGVGIADKWTGHAQDESHWRDSHYRVVGPAAVQMQATFLDNWMRTRSSVLFGNDYLPEAPKVGGSKAQVFRSSAREGSESVRLMYLLSIACAKKSILISSAYFVPDDLAIRYLLDARKRGVKVEIIVPGPIMDSEISRRASRGMWGDMLNAGIQFYEYQPTMYHCKVMIVDGIWVSVGSTNFDDRSFRLNDEANLNVFDREFASRQTTFFEDDKRNSKLITLEQWEKRPMTERISERLALLLRSQL